MKAESHREHAGAEAYVVVNPVSRTAVFVQTWYMRAYPGADVRKRIKASGLQIRFVAIDRRCPINGNATQDEAEKEWHVQPVTAPNQQVVPASYTHAGSRLRRA